MSDLLDDNYGFESFEDMLLSIDHTKYEYQTRGIHDNCLIQNPNINNLNNDGLLHSKSFEDLLSIDCTKDKPEKRETNDNLLIQNPTINNLNNDGLSNSKSFEDLLLIECTKDKPEKRETNDNLLIQNPTINNLNNDGLSNSKSIDLNTIDLTEDEPEQRGTHDNLLIQNPTINNLNIDGLPNSKSIDLDMIELTKDEHNKRGTHENLLNQDQNINIFINEGPLHSLFVKPGTMNQLNFMKLEDKTCIKTSNGSQINIFICRKIEPPQIKRFEGLLSNKHTKDEPEKRGTNDNLLIQNPTIINLNNDGLPKSKRLVVVQPRVSELLKNKHGEISPATLFTQKQGVQLFNNDGTNSSQSALSRVSELHKNKPEHEIYLCDNNVPTMSNVTTFGVQGGGLVGNDRWTEREPPKVPKPYRCDQCDRQYVLKSSLNRHQKTIHNQKISLKCNECTANFSRPYHLQRHVQQVHCIVRQYECQVCRMTFLQEKSLKSHQVVHTLKPPLGCTECGKLFRQRRSLYSHMYAHTATGVKMHRCNECGTSFNQASYLQAHMHQHVNPRRFACPDCRKGFYLREFLRLRQHCGWSQVKDSCVVCGREFIDEVHGDGPLAYNNTMPVLCPFSCGSE